jgi:tripartite-type tricarboxylate transporter receptor subunit TctC
MKKQLKTAALALSLSLSLGLCPGVHSPAQAQAQTAGATAASASSWPEKTVTIILPFPAGGATDMLGRALAARMQETFGRTFIVDNRPGATGTIGAGQVKRAAPDGYTLLVASLGPFVIAPHLIKDMTFDPRQDFDLLTVAVQAPNVLLVPSNSPHKTVADVLAFHMAKPGTMTFASSGNGASDHLTAELFWLRTGTTGVHVPYKGGAPAIADLLGGQVDASFQNVNAVIQHVKAGKLRALAVTGDKRSPVLPDVPTIAESALPDFEAVGWFGVVAPAATPREIIARLNAEIVRGLAAADVRERISALGAELAPSTPDELDRFNRAQIAQWAKVVKFAGARPE